MPMKRRSLLTAAPVAFMLLLMLGAVSPAAEVKVLSSISMQAIMEDLGPKFERATGPALPTPLRWV
jgi:ABC-type molybdate transport system substrate-binding protein